MCANASADAHRAAHTKCRTLATAYRVISSRGLVTVSSKGRYIVIKAKGKMVNRKARVRFTYASTRRCSGKVRRDGTRDLSCGMRRVRATRYVRLRSRLVLRKPSPRRGEKDYAAAIYVRGFTAGDARITTLHLGR